MHLIHHSWINNIISKGKIQFSANFDLLGAAIGTTSLLNNTTYGPSSFTLNVGIYLRNAGYTDLFDTAGKFISLQGRMDFNMTFEIQFLSKDTAVSRIISKIIIQNDEFIEKDQTQFQGIQYRIPFAFNDNIMYNVGPLKFLVDFGNYIKLVTEYDFMTQSEGTLTRMNGKFTINRNPFCNP